MKATPTAGARVLCHYAGILEVGVATIAVHYNTIIGNATTHEYSFISNVTT